MAEVGFHIGKNFWSSYIIVTLIEDSTVTLLKGRLTQLRSGFGISVAWALYLPEFRLKRNGVKDKVVQRKILSNFHTPRDSNIASCKKLSIFSKKNQKIKKKT